MSASREKKLRQDQTASGYVDPKAEKELEEKKAEKQQQRSVQRHRRTVRAGGGSQLPLEIQCDLRNATALTLTAKPTMPPR